MLLLKVGLLELAEEKEKRHTRERDRQKRPKIANPRWPTSVTSMRDLRKIFRRTTELYSCWIWIESRLSYSSSFQYKMFNITSVIVMLEHINGITEGFLLRKSWHISPFKAACGTLIF